MQIFAAPAGFEARCAPYARISSRTTPISSTPTASRTTISAIIPADYHLLTLTLTLTLTLASSRLPSPSLPHLTLTHASSRLPSPSAPHPSPIVTLRASSPRNELSSFAQRRICLSLLLLPLLCLC